jgi:hypothetical protein
VHAAARARDALARGRRRQMFSMVLAVMALEYVTQRYL